MRRPPRCSCQWRRTIVTSSKPVWRSRLSSSSASAQSRSGPRNHSPSGMLIPIFAARPAPAARGDKAPAARAICWYCRALWPRAAAASRFHDPVIEQRHARFQRHGHAGAIDLGQNIVGQISDQIEKLHPRHQVGKFFRQRRVVEQALRLPRLRHDFGRLPMADQGGGKLRRRCRAAARWRLCAPCRRPAAAGAVSAARRAPRSSDRD